MLTKEISWKSYFSSLLFYLFLQGPAYAQSLTITWNDNSENEEGFFVERTVSEDCVDGWEVIGYAGINQNTFTDIRIPGACYRVAAYNENVTSAYSNTVRAEPLIAPPIDASQCKKGGWAIFKFPRAFKNRGDCVKFVKTGK